MITGVVLARNEESNIVPCLRALERHVSEIILIDMESADRTVDLARPYCDQVLAHPLVANFDSARNLAIPVAKNDWLWFVDADEWITDQVGQMVNDVVRQRGHTFEAINIPFMSHFCGQWMQRCGWWPGYTCPRVLKRGHFEFSRTLHGGVKHTGREIRFPADASTAIPHYSYSSVEHWVRKCNGYTTTESMQLAERGHQWDWRFANHMMMQDLWAYFEKNRANEDGDRGWILTWLSAQYRWLSAAKLIDTAKEKLPPDSRHSVPNSLDEVLQAMTDELAYCRKGSATPPLGIVWRSSMLAESAEAELTISVVPLLAEGTRPVVLEPTEGQPDSALLRALARGRRPRHTLTITMGATGANPDPVSALNVLIPLGDVSIAQLAPFDDVWVGSESERNSIRQMGGVPEKIRVVPLGEHTSIQDILAAIEALEQRLVVAPPPAQSANQIPVEIEGEFFAGHSFANINEQIGTRLAADPRLALSLRRRRGIATLIEPLGPARRLKSYVERPLSHGPQVTVRHAFPPNWHRPASGRWVHIQPWEFGHLPADWIGPLRDEVDEIWVPSHYVEDIYVKSGVAREKIHVIPWGVDLECFSPGAPPLNLPTEKSFRFLFVGGTIWRKGFDRVLEAYLSEFTPADDVALVIKDQGTKTFYPDNMSEQIAAALRDPGTPQIVYIDADYSPGQLASLYSACHCLVAPYRGEGFCLPVLEGMASGLSVIVPQGGPTDDFVTPQTGVMLPSRTTEARLHDEPTPGKPFTVLDVNAIDLRRAMRRMAEMGQDERRQTSRSAREQAERYPWSRTCDLMVERIEALATPSVSHVPPVKTTIAAWLGVRNDERRLADLLCHVQPFVDEVIVADLGSQDRSLAIAREYGARIVTLQDDESEEALHLASRESACDWILGLTAEDHITESTAMSLRDAAAAQPAHVGQFNVQPPSDRPLVLRRRAAVGVMA